MCFHEKSEKAVVVIIIFQIIKSFSVWWTLNRWHPISRKRALLLSELTPKASATISVSSLHFHRKSEKKVFPYFSSTMKYSTSRITMTQSQKLWSNIDQFFCFVQIIHYDIIKRERCNFNFPLPVFIFRLLSTFSDYFQRVKGKKLNLDLKNPWNTYVHFG